MVIVGDGPCRQSLQQSWPSAIFSGKQREEALASHYASGDLLLFPSLTETFGNVTLEAMASGLGVVAFNYGSAAGAIQHGKSGWLAERGDEEAFVASALRAAAHPDELRKARTAAASKASQMSWDHVLSDLMQVYSKAIFTHGGAHTATGSHAVT
jgi:glycosyltransferase involved in cell wall biosynthesis